MTFVENEVNGPEQQPQEPTVEDALRQVVHRQEIVISVMRDRILELELEVINGRCNMVDHTH